MSFRIISIWVVRSRVWKGLVDELDLLKLVDAKIFERNDDSLENNVNEYVAKKKRVNKIENAAHTIIDAEAEK